ncbi:hypothetical protein [Pseudoroseicyclus aestuarii]|uniref:Uncharacterized protein n=1 Tax=Pseudoroseicyclus aestuarii TaxID=1795041 RepID=A0A318SLY5_9RHOB|nr:hypothetical protein [Pseudoroseicyclus aestuarii]PYE80834.1 hypothetical protein DFP88_11144 [Pseudoroseicyclus aestuarii]
MVGLIHQYLPALCDSLDRLGPEELTLRLESEVLRHGGTWQQDANDGPAVREIAVHGIAMSALSYSQAAVAWRFAARVAVGGYADVSPDPKVAALQRAWALAVLHHVVPAPEAIHANAQALLDRMTQPDLITIPAPSDGGFRSIDELLTASTPVHADGEPQPEPAA